MSRGSRGAAQWPDGCSQVWSRPQTSHRPTIDAHAVNKRQGAPYEEYRYGLGLTQILTVTLPATLFPGTNPTSKPIHYTLSPLPSPFCPLPSPFLLSALSYLPFPLPSLFSPLPSPFALRPSPLSPISRVASLQVRLSAPLVCARLGPWRLQWLICGSWHRRFPFQAQRAVLHPHWPTAKLQPACAWHRRAPAAQCPAADAGPPPAPGRGSRDPQGPGGTGSKEGCEVTAVEGGERCRKRDRHERSTL